MHTLAPLDSSRSHSRVLSLSISQSLPLSFPYFPILSPNILSILAVAQRTSCYFPPLTTVQNYPTYMYRVVYETCKANETQSEHMYIVRDQS